jgi:hypothetical protein
MANDGADDVSRTKPIQLGMKSLGAWPMMMKRGLTHGVMVRQHGEAQGTQKGPYEYLTARNPNKGES